MSEINTIMWLLLGKNILLLDGLGHGSKIVVHNDHRLLIYFKNNIQEGEEILIIDDKLTYSKLN